MFQYTQGLLYKSPKENGGGEAFVRLWLIIMTKKIKTDFKEEKDDLL